MTQARRAARAAVPSRNVSMVCCNAVCCAGGSASICSTRRSTLRLGFLDSTGPPQSIGRYFQRRGAAQNHVGVEAEFASLVVADQRLDHPSLLGQLDLGEAPLASTARQALAGLSSLGGKGISFSFEALGMIEAGSTKG